MEVLKIFFSKTPLDVTALSLGENGAYTLQPESCHNP
jgi:hypothetical protein